ncbi:MAG: quinate 5-dehydrogenase [Clostridia bacterium]|nr:quinate 5-dehydrogenase [Clostridia bacterium]
MKHVVSVSIGSSKRDHKARAEFLGEEFIIERIGTDGDIDKAISLIKELDGKVDAFGMGGTDLYLTTGSRRYLIRDAAKILKAAQKTPMVDGGGLKNILEYRAVKYLAREKGMDFRGKRVLITAAVDRYGMALAFDEEGARLVMADLVFALKIPLPFRTMRQLRIAASILAPIIVRLPFKMLYPTGSEQEKTDSESSKLWKYYQEADIIGGDFLFIRRHMPPSLPGRIIVTNTVTAADIEFLRQRGIRTLVTTTPELEGRSFGTNVMEAVMVALLQKPLAEIKRQDYEDLIDRMGLVPRIVELN